MPLVTVILGTYNSTRYLREALDSVFAQTFRDYEVIVVDDASTDDTVELLKTYGERVRVVRRATNSATCELPRYQGTAAARGTYCAFLDADDLWTPDKLEKQVAYLKAHPDTPICHTYVRVIDGEGRPLHVRHEGAMPVGEDMKRSLLSHCYITISSVVVRREVWLAAVREKEIVDFGMDQDFFLRIAREYPIGFVPEVLGAYRRSTVSVGQKKWRRNPRNVNTLSRIYRQGWWKGIVSRGAMRHILYEAIAEDADFWRFNMQPLRSLWFCAYGMRRAPWRIGWYIRAAKAVGRAVSGPRAVRSKVSS